MRLYWIPADRESSNVLECHPTCLVVIAVEDPDVVVDESACVNRGRWETTTNDVENQRDAPGSPPFVEVYVPRAHSNAEVAGIAICFLGPKPRKREVFSQPELHRKASKYWSASSSEARVRRRHDVPGVVVEICDCVSVHVVERPDQLCHGESRM